MEAEYDLWDRDRVFVRYFAELQTSQQSPYFLPNSYEISVIKTLSAVEHGVRTLLAPTLWSTLD
jgi:hypothetical protein